MGVSFFALLILGGAALYFMTPAERKRLAAVAIARATAFVHALRHRTAPDPFHELLQARTPRPMAAPLLIVVCVLVWMGTISSTDPAPPWLIAAGASYAPRTTNGEWWRLAAYAFVHAGLFHLLTTIGALLSLGVVLERLAGRLTFAMVYLASGIVAGAVGLWTLPATTPMFGPSGAIFGLYGLLGAVAVYGYLRQPRLPWSPRAVKRLAAGAAPFVLYSVFTNSVTTVSELAGLATGLFAGLVVARGVVVRKPSRRAALLVPAAVAIVALLAALPRHGVIDARPTIARIVEVESGTAEEYAKAVVAFTKGRTSARTLVQVIQRNILPALQAERARIESLRGVPVEQQPLVAAARQYFDLREHSWRRRAEGLLGSNARTLKDADLAERAALDAFDQLRRGSAVPPSS